MAGLYQSGIKVSYISTLRIILTLLGFLPKPMEVIEIIRKNELFDGLDNNELETLTTLTRLKKASRNTFIIKEGDESQEMYVIKQGKAEVMLNNENGDELILTTLHEGAIFGELSLLDGKPRSANVIALEDCVLLVIQKADFYEFLYNNNNAYIQVIKYLCQKLRKTNQIAHSYALLDVFERLVKYLYSEAQYNTQGKLVITSPHTQKEIAIKICTGREVVSRMLNRLEKDGYLTIQNKTITIIKELPAASYNEATTCR
jgi:CRP/FNR family transcriptional regulator, cyclic AMP receptor protein